LEQALGVTETQFAVKAEFFDQRLDESNTSVRVRDWSDCNRN